MCTDMPRTPDTRPLDVIEAAREIDEPAFSPSEIAESVEVGETRVRQILNELETEGMVECKRFGSGKGWWLADP